mgnify:CR=1 FL=1
MSVADSDTHSHLGVDEFYLLLERGNIIPEARNLTLHLAHHLVSVLRF